MMNIKESPAISIVMVLLAGIFIANSAYSSNDSIKVYRTPPITVDSKRVLSREQIKYSAVSVLSDSLFDMIVPREISDVLIYAPGLFIKDYGGAGGLETVSIRGSSAAQTMIMLDGIRINSSQNSIVDLSTIPASFLGSAEIIRGGNSAIYGGNAMSGAVNLISKSRKEKKLSFEYGSFGEMLLSASYSDDFASSRPGLMLEFKSGEGDFPFEINDYGEIKEYRRRNADYKNFSGLAFYDYSAEKINFNIKYLINRSEKGLPGTAFAGNIENAVARYDETQNMVLASADFSAFSVKFKSGGLIKYHQSIFKDEENIVTKNRYSAYDELGALAFTRGEISMMNSEIGNITLRPEIEYSYSSLEGNFLDDKSGGYILRNNFAASLSAEVANEYDLLSTGINLAMRYDEVSDVGSEFSPMLGFLVDFREVGIVVNASASGNFRLPSFNEMYYLNYGNSELLPEHSVSYNLGATSQIFTGLRLSANLFYIDTRDKIVSMPTSPISWSARNVKRSTSTGLELQVNASEIFNIFGIFFNYTYQEAINKTKGDFAFNKLLEYVPKHIFSGVIEAGVGDFSISLMSEFSSKRYYLPGEIRYSEIDEYLLLSTMLSYSLNNLLNLRLFLKVENINDIDYVIIRNYPMPGRVIKVGASVRF